MKIYLNFIFEFILAVEISGYENIALHKPVSMSSVYGTFGPSLTNDGRTDIQWNQNTCSHTQRNSARAWWQVDLENIHPIKVIGIFYREGYAYRFAGFSIFVSNTSTFEEGEECFHYTSYQLPPVVNNWTCAATGRYVTIYNERNASLTYPSDYSLMAFLELCEVEVYGCPYGRFGPTCSGKCFCSNATCDFESGMCPGDCKDGYVGETCNLCKAGRYGGYCDKVCGQCVSDVNCDSISGSCPTGCKDGWKPPNCDEKCDDGYFGPSCSQRCGFCLNGEFCDNVNGSCPNGCALRYIGDYCNKVCEPGRYGDGCKGQCGKCREYTNCDPATGYCVYGCRKGWQEPDCKEVCPKGLYGKNCSYSCGSCSNDETCDPVTGVCKNGCKAGFLGSKCDKVFERGNHGLDCTDNCGNCYRDEPCHHTNGTCPNGCLPGWEKPLCISCIPGYFGPDCVNRCGKCLNNEPCDQSSGSCAHGCLSGWNGSRCEYKILYNGERIIYLEKINVPSVVVPCLITLVVIIGCIFVSLRRRRVHTESDMALLFSEAQANGDVKELDQTEKLIDRQENAYQMNTDTIKT